MFDNGTIRARRNDPVTSHTAAESVEDIFSVQHGIITVLTRWGPCTDEKIAMLYQGPKASPSGLRTRRKELVAAGVVVDSGRKERLATGRQGIRWMLDDSW